MTPDSPDKGAGDGCVPAMPRRFSIILLAYNNGEYIYEALDSVLSQDWEELELIVSDDGSGCFDPEEVREYVCRRRGNLTNLVVNLNPRNLGTVRHVETLLPLCSGDYVGIFAADDAYADGRVLSDVAAAFETWPEAGVVSSNIVMCGETLSDEGPLFVSRSDIEMINAGDARLLFSHMACHCVLPALGTFYRRGTLERVGELSRRYALVEDWTTYVILAREGVTFRFLDRVSGRHRGGGVSHGNRRNQSETARRYLADLIRVYEDEVAPYRDRLLKKNALIAELNNRRRRTLLRRASQPAMPGAATAAAVTHGGGDAQDFFRRLSRLWQWPLPLAACGLAALLWRLAGGGAPLLTPLAVLTALSVVLCGYAGLALLSHAAACRGGLELKTLMKRVVGIFAPLPTAAYCLPVCALLLAAAWLCPGTGAVAAALRVVYAGAGCGVALTGAGASALGWAYKFLRYWEFQDGK